MANEKRLIYAEDLVETIVSTPSEVANMYTYNVLNSLVDRTNEILDLIDNAPTVDAVEVVRCEDCAWYRKEFGKCVNPKCGKSGYGCPVTEDHYCGYGERKNNHE